MKRIICVLSLAFAMVTVSTSDLKAQTVKQKTTTSRKGKYALVGGAGGAATGALVSHHHAKGALIGGAVGAGAGYLVGRHKDKKNPQVRHVTKIKD